MTTRAANEDLPRRRIRLSPEKRQAMILEITAKLVSDEGVSAVTMDRVGREAGISKSLVYNYFPNLSDLLKATLERELRVLRGGQAVAAREAETFEGLVRGVTKVYLNYIQDRGLIIERLQAEPSLSAVSDPTQYGREGAVHALAMIVAKQFSLPMPIASAVTDISFGIPAAAGAFLLHGDLPAEKVEELTVQMILGSIKGVVEHELISERGLRD